jgi:hypothetical protein
MNDALGIVALLIEGEDDRVGNEKQRTSDRTLSDGLGLHQGMDVK